MKTHDKKETILFHIGPGIMIFLAMTSSITNHRFPRKIHSMIILTKLMIHLMVTIATLLTLQPLTIESLPTTTPDQSISKDLHNHLKLSRLKIQASSKNSD